MTVTTSYEFTIDSTYWHSFVSDDHAVAAVNGGYVFGGFGTSGTITAAQLTTLPGGPGIQSGTELALTGLTNGNYVAATQDGISVLYQIFAVGGVAVTAVMDTGDSGTSNPDVAALNNGGFVIACEDQFSGADYDIHLRFYNSAGVLQNTVIADFTAATDRDASVAVLDNGNVAVGWVRTVGAETEIWTAVYSQAGALLTPATLVDTNGTINQSVELVATSGGYAMVYVNNIASNATPDIQLLTLNSLGTQTGALSLTIYNNASTSPAITRLSNGLVVVGWNAFQDDTTLALIDPATMNVLTQVQSESNPFVGTGAPELAAFGIGRLAMVSPTTFDFVFGHTNHAQISEITAQRVMTSDAASDNIVAQNDMSHLLIGNDGNDKLTGGAAADELDGGTGNDTLDGKGGNNTLRGGAGNDTYFVNSQFGDVIIEGVNGGTDKVTSTAAVYGLADNVENLTLGTGAEQGYGNDGANTLTGNSADNVLVGYGGKDKLDGKGGADVLYGGDGDDSYYLDNVGDVVVEDAGAAAGKKDTVNISYTGADYTLGANVENGNLTGSGVQILRGNDLANTLTSKGNSNAVNHFLIGGGGKDVLKGDAGLDILIGGTGADTLTGGAGIDFFQFDVLETSANKDTIKDFSHADDEIDFSSGAFAGLGGAAGHRLSDNVATQDMFFLGASAGDAEDRIIYDSGTGNLYYDADGLGGAAQILVAVLSTKPVNVDASDFYIF